MSKKGRYVKVILLIGAPGTGKSWVEAKMIKNSYFPNAILYKNFIDVEEDATKDYTCVPFFKYTGGKHIISSADISYPALIRAAFRGFRYGSLAIDDTRNFEPNVALSKDFRNFLGKRRKAAVDFYLKYHSFGSVHGQLWEYVTDIVMFHTADDVPMIPRFRSRIPYIRERKEVIRQQYEKGNKHYHEHIQLL